MTVSQPQRVVGVNIDITERKRSEEHRSLLNAELDHRVKNVLATVVAIIVQSQNDKRSMADFVDMVESRISLWRHARLAQPKPLAWGIVARDHSV